MPKNPLQGLLLGESPAMTAVRESIAAAVTMDAPVLVEGERGTGRERVAHALHDTGPRKGRGFVCFDTTSGADGEPALDADLSRAEGGTLLVKDIGQIGRPAQRRLLRLVRGRGGGARGATSGGGGGGGATAGGGGGAAEVRLIAATHVDLARAAANDLFDAELYERLLPARIALPPLRARMDDVPLLATHFARAASARLGRSELRLAPGAVDRMLAYPWPGNVGELKDTMERLALRVPRARLEAADVDEELPRLAEKVPLEQMPFEEMVRAKIRVLLEQMSGYPVKDLYDEVISRVERPLFELVLEQTAGNQVRAAEMLGLNRNTLRKKIAERGLHPDPRKK